MDGRARSWPLSIYLLRRDVTRPERALKRHPSLRQLQIGHGRSAIGTLYYRTTDLRPPRWVEFFGDHVSPRDFRASSVAAVLVMRAGGRLFAVTFGHGRHLLEPMSYEEGFGLRVTLNSVTPDSIRTIDRIVLDATGRHTREQASRNIPIVEFGLDIDKDILRAVTGPPEDQTLGKRLAGADSLSVVAPIRLPELPDRLEAYLAQYGKRTYRDRFPWVDNIRDLRDKAKVTNLDDELVERIRSQQFERLWLAVPDLVDWSDVAGFAHSPAESAERFDDISFATYLEQVRRSEDLSIGTLRRHRVFCISAETDAPRSEWPVYRCIYAEVERSDGTYLLNNGKWYQVDTDYLREVNRAVSKITPSAEIQFPRYQAASEVEYNRGLCATDEAMFVLLDGKTIPYGGGSSRIEFCDVYTGRKEIVHVKRYGGSSVLSHLFAQGVVSANLFLADAGFRAAVNRLLPARHKLGSTDTRPRSEEFEVGYAIASKDEGDLVLPFFSRVTLRSAYQQLSNMGYRITLTKIQA